MIVGSDKYKAISKNSNNRYWEQGFYPDWTAINAFCGFPNQVKGSGVESHYHDNDEIWLFTAGRGEVWLDGQRFEVTPNTMVYTPMGVVHQFQMFTDYENNAIVTRLERQKRPVHILVEEAGPPEPTVSGFVVPGTSNNGPFVNRGPRCPLSELRLVIFSGSEDTDEVSLSCNEHWLVLEGVLHIFVDGREFMLSEGDVMLIRAGTMRRIRPHQRTRAVLAREVNLL